MASTKAPLIRIQCPGCLTKDILWSIPGRSMLSIARSTLISNKEWKDLGDQAK
jgi:hypothetical protein